MDMTMSRTGKLVVFAAILAIFAAGGWYVGAPQSFHTAMVDAGVAAQPAAPAPLAAPAQDSPAPPPGGEAAGH